MRVGWVLLVLLVGATVLPAEPPFPFAGMFYDDNITLILDSDAPDKPVTGTVSRAGHDFSLEANVTGDRLSGTFVDPLGKKYPFKARFSGTMLIFETGQSVYRLRWDLTQRRPTDGDSSIRAIQDQLGGVGVQVEETLEHAFRVGWVVPDSPAHRAGVRSGDEIVEVDGFPSEDLERDELRQLLQGKAGTEARMGVRKPSGTVRTVTVQRERARMFTEPSRNSTYPGDVAPGAATQPTTQPAQ